VQERLQVLAEEKAEQTCNLKMTLPGQEKEIGNSCPGSHMAGSSLTGVLIKS
jgi:hypothetical protein